jgi:hypothetical protein
MFRKLVNAVDAIDPGTASTGGRNGLFAGDRL